MEAEVDSKATLILCEKPSASARISRALDEKGKPQKKQLETVPYYEAYRNGKKLVVVAALGHLYTVAPAIRNRSVYPVFDFMWVPKYEAEKDAKRTKPWIDTISRLSKEAHEYVLATDYDIEGATLGYTILKYACGDKENETKRMKFSTLTTRELCKSYSQLLDHIEFPTVEAGICRHFLDAMYGINLSRAMTIAAKRSSGRYATISTGRVQGPTLTFLAEREKQINAFVPTPYWTIKAKVEVGGSLYDVEYERGSIETQSKADEVVEACRGKKGTIADIEIKQFHQSPPVPFDLGTLQTEAYGIFKFPPRRTGDIAERLYLDALISYPRTSSQKLPPSINYEGILKGLTREPKYRKLTDELLKLGRLVPNEGKKEDPAHPAIYPTGNLPERALGGPEGKLWDLVVKRFMATFGEPAVKQSMKVSISVNGHLFFLWGRQVLKEGWMLFYKPYVQPDEVLLPPLEKGQQVDFKEIARQDAFTKPPPRYNPSSLLKRMEDEGIGTKATRADIIETLYARAYIREERMTVSELGFDVTNVLSKYCPEVLSVSFTRELEEKMEKIQRDEEKKENVLATAVDRLKPVLEELKRQEATIGQDLSEAVRKAQIQERILGACPVCGTGKLMIIYSRRTGKRFAGCTNFFKGLCKASSPLPQKGTVKPTRKSCKVCGWPTVQFKMQGKRPWTLCINVGCPSKEGKKR